MAPKEIHKDTVETLAEYYPSYATVKKWATEFKLDRENTENDAQSGHPKTSNTDDTIHHMILNDRYLLSNR